MTEIRNAATIVLIRNKKGSNFVLMGQRLPTIAFMPRKYVFPGGVWERLDNDVPVSKTMNNREKNFLSLETNFVEGPKLGITAIRELWEETGLRLSCRGNFDSFPSSWEEFFSDGQGPNLSSLNFFFRAITPPGRIRRFDARFFFSDARYIADDLDDFSKASGELSPLKWVEISQAKNLNLPKITCIALEHLMTIIKDNFKYYNVPFYFESLDGFKEKKLRL